MAFFLRLAKSGSFKSVLSHDAWTDDLGPFVATFNGGEVWPGFFQTGRPTTTINQVTWDDGTSSFGSKMITVNSFVAEVRSLGIDQWNSIKAAEFENFGRGVLGVVNTVDVTVRSPKEIELDLRVLGAKRGSVEGSDKADRIIIEVDSNARGDKWNTFLISTYGGDDNIEIKKSDFDWTATGGFKAAYQESWTVTRVDLGDGNNDFKSGGSRDFVIGGSGLDGISTGAGNDVARPGLGFNIFSGGAGCDILEVAATPEQIEIYLLKNVLGELNHLIASKPGHDVGSVQAIDVEWLRLLGRNLSSPADDVWVRLIPGACDLAPSWARKMDIGALLGPVEEAASALGPQSALAVSPIARAHLDDVL